MAKHVSKQIHSPEDVARVASLFFAVRGLVRTKLAQGKKLDPYAWLRIETMIHIRDNSGLSMRAIAEHLSITAPSATSLVSSLIKGSLVRRERNKKDARASCIHLTKKGEKLLAMTQTKGRKVLGDVFAPLSPKELTTLNHFLERVLKAR